MAVAGHGGVDEEVAPRSARDRKAEVAWLRTVPRALRPTMARSDPRWAAACRTHERPALWLLVWGGSYALLGSVCGVMFRSWVFAVLGAAFFGAVGFANWAVSAWAATTTLARARTAAA